MRVKGQLRQGCPSSGPAGPPSPKGGRLRRRDEGIPPYGAGRRGRRPLQMGRM
nr:MAG TPA: hypothetical protein [Caudoviricetes sp.]